MWRCHLGGLLRAGLTAPGLWPQRCTSMVDPARRLLLRGRLAAARSAPTPAPRPPWVVGDESRFTTSCTRCDACIAACPEHILQRGDGGYPEVGFKLRGCTECGACARACGPNALVRHEGQAPWAWRIAISDACLARQRVECRVCGEICPHGAIRFRPELGGIAQPRPALETCTGCGACVAPCPTQAIQMQPPAPAREG